jgi:hypothetical protein
MRFSLRILPQAALALLLCMPFAEAGESNLGRISGVIKSASGNPLYNAFINIFKVGQKEEIQPVTAIRSNSSGLFRASDLAPGTYFLQIRSQGYRALSTNWFEIEPERTTLLDVTLENVIDFMSNDEDPSNWNLKTVMRSSSDSRMIFRYLPADAANSGADSPFVRSGYMSLASSTSPGSMQYLMRPHSNRNGVVTNFAFAEPFGRDSRMIFSGQFDVGSRTFWRIRDTFNYRPDKYHDYRISLGYGRMNLGTTASDSIGPDMPNHEPYSRESGVQSIAFGVEGTTKFYDLFAIHYGFDYSHLRYKTDRSFVHPSLEIIVSPVQGWRFSTSFTSKRDSAMNRVAFSNGEVLDLSEPTLITVVGDDISMSRVRHGEVAMEKSFSPITTLGFALYRDNTYGPGIPLMVTMITPEGRSSAIVNLNESRSRQQGMRITLNRQMLPNLSGSLSYVYGEAISVSDIDESLSIDRLNRAFQNYASQQYYHSFAGRFDLSIPETETNILATILWHPGNPLSTIDSFSDSMDIGSKSLNFEVRQAVPFQGLFMETGCWEILLDFRNVLNQGEEVIPASDGVLVLNRSPRSLRFGFNLNFR